MNYAFVRSICHSVIGHKDKKCTFMFVYKRSLKSRLSKCSLTYHSVTFEALKAYHGSYGKRSGL